MNIRSEAVEFAKGVILRSTDWQEVQTALFEHEKFGPWLQEADLDGISIIREAERKLGSKLPSTYAD